MKWGDFIQKIGKTSLESDTENSIIGNVRFLSIVELPIIHIPISLIIGSLL